MPFPALDRFCFTVLDIHVHAGQLGLDDVSGGLPEKPPDDRRGNVRHGLGLLFRTAELRGSCYQHGGVFPLLVGQGHEPIRPTGAFFVPDGVI